MLSVGPVAARFSPSQDIRVILSLPPFGNVHYRQHPLNGPRIRARTPFLWQHIHSDPVDTLAIRRAANEPQNKTPV
jgi:hypothetical protein